MSIDLKALGLRSIINHRKRANSASPRDSFDDHLVQEKENASSAIPISGINPFLALQELDTSYDEDRQKMTEVGTNLLSHLNRIRFGLINGEIDVKLLSNLQEIINNQKIELRFPALQQVIDEIQVRAAVELAKLENKP
jgi:hypothetical protein